MTQPTAPTPRRFLGVTISSTFTDLEKHRSALIKMIRGNGMTDIAMENDSAKLSDILESSLQMVRDGAAYIGVIGKKYGQTPTCPTRNPDQLSITELEFNEAQRLGRPILLFIMGDDHLVLEKDIETSSARRKKLAEFKERAKKTASSVHRIYATFQSLDDFKQKIAPSIAGLRRHLDDDAHENAADRESQRTDSTRPANLITVDPSHALQIRINPTRNGRRQLAQILLLNTGARPILIDSWYAEWSDRSGVETIRCERGSLPIRLQDHERVDLLVDISKKSVEELTAIGVFDAERRLWKATDIDIQRFTHIAKTHAPPAINQPDEIGEPSNVDIVVRATRAKNSGAERLEVHFRNLGPNDLVPRSARVEWTYEPTRWQPREQGQPQVGESSGSLSLQLEGHRTPITPMNEAVFFLEADDQFAQLILAVLADDVPDHQIRVAVVASHWEWAAADDEVPGAIRDFAKAVLKRIH